MTEWTWAAASSRGTSHERRGEPKQDAFRVVDGGRGSGLLAVVACDGAGSSPRGGAGAAIAARGLGACAAAWIGGLGRVPHPDAVIAWMLHARRHLVGLADRYRFDASDIATTAVLVVSDGERSVTAHVGDGAVVAREASTGRWISLSWPEHGEYASTTRFLTDPEGLSLRVAEHGVGIDRIAVMTDGLERLALDFGRRTPHAAFLEPMSAALGGRNATGRADDVSEALVRYLGSDRINDRTDDDKTLVLASRS